MTINALHCEQRSRVFLCPMHEKITQERLPVIVSET